MLLRRPVEWPSWISADTPKRSPYWVERSRSRVRSSAAAPPGMVWVGSGISPLAGETRVPALEYCRVCGPPTSTPSIRVYTCHSLGLAVRTKYIDCECGAPSESYTVTEVVWL